MILHHPDDNLLTEYASGSLALALGLSVSAHLQFCAACRKRVEHLNKLGAVILTNSVSEPIAQGAFDQLMARIKSQPAAPASVETPKSAVAPIHPNYLLDPMLAKLPKVVARLLPSNGVLRWQRVSAELRTARLALGQSQYEVAFQRITSGGRVVEHDHRGLEVTLVLQGSFSDEKGIYHQGDFLVRQPGEVHRPTATQNEDCLCLSVTEAPVAVTGFLGRIINPFLSFKPA